MDTNAILDELEKIASMGGQDLRKGFMGMHTNFPTQDSKSLAKGLLNQSRKAAEVGPAPTVGKLNPKGPTVQDLTPSFPSNKGSLPKIGGVMNYSEDPLVQYLKKQAEEMTNINEMPQGDGKEEPQVDEDPEPTEEVTRGFVKKHTDYLGRLFDNKAFRDKFEQKFK